MTINIPIGIILLITHVACIVFGAFLASRD